MIALVPKERAKELVDKFNVDLRPFSEHGHWDIEHAKDCALKCVDEILKANAIWYVDSIPYQYYMKVKKQIELL